MPDVALAVEAAATAHVFPADTSELLAVARTLSTEDLAGLMGISGKLAELNHERFQGLAVPHQAGVGDALPAVLLFDGDVYKGLDAWSLSAADLTWAQDHVAILSGLYGLLRPLDLAAPYRLEMGSRLKTARGKDLYAFWGDRLARRLDAMLEGHPEPVLLDLASQEYNSAIDGRVLRARRVEVQFKEVREGKARVISFFAKRARGLMARFLVTQRVDRVQGLRDFAAEGYAYAPELSSDASLVFTRAS